jgi:CPA2 family monovalent cation:H+ antiporter-2
MEQFDLSSSVVGILTMGIITQKLRLSPIVGYLLAGVAIGPFTPGRWRRNWRKSA